MDFKDVFNGCDTVSEVKKATISRRLANKDLCWAHEVNVNDKHTVIVDFEGERFLMTTRNYYYGFSSDKKMHYSHMSTEKSSVEHYMDIYIHVKDNIFVHAIIATDTSVFDHMKRVIANHNQFTPEQKEQAVANVMASLTYI